MEEEKPAKKSVKELHDEHIKDYWSMKSASMKNWRAWGSWFSWGSPIGLTLGYAITIVSTGVFIWLLALAHNLRK